MNNSAALTIWGRWLAVVAAIVFLISSTFPVIAGVSKNTWAFPKWWGPLDVGLAFVLVILAFAIVALTQGKVDKQTESKTYRAYRVLIHGILVMLVVFFLSGDRIIWINCVTGFAWRTWLLLYGLPAWFTALRGTAYSSRLPAK
jgi:hypothetical protein